MTEAIAVRRATLADAEVIGRNPRGRVRRRPGPRVADPARRVPPRSATADLLHQGRGLGSEILSTVLERADSAGVATYLEASCERNLHLYRRHHFEVIEDVSLLGKGPTIWRMWREPQA
jgi:GNAT superfamily N-acetyltransferase